MAVFVCACLFSELPSAEVDMFRQRSTVFVGIVRKSKISATLGNLFRSRIRRGNAST